MLAYHHDGLLQSTTVLTRNDAEEGLIRGENAGLTMVLDLWARRTLSITNDHDFKGQEQTSLNRINLDMR